MATYASPKQLFWIDKLVTDPRLTPDTRAQAIMVLGAPLATPVGKLLDDMFAQCPKTKAAKATGPNPEHVFGAEFPGITPGYYAIPSSGSNDLQFFKVTFGSQFTKAEHLQDRVWVKRVIGGHPEYGVKPEVARQLLASVTDAPAAQKLYGQQIGKCGKCGHALTDAESRAYGIGPDCRAKYFG